MNHKRLYAVTTEFKTVQQLAAEAIARYREQPAQVRLPSLDSITVREGAGMSWLPSMFRYWWETPLEHKPAPGEVQRALYGRSSCQS